MMKFDVEIPEDLLRAFGELEHPEEMFESLATKLQRRVVKWYAGKPDDYFDGPHHMQAPGGRTFMRGIADPTKWEPSHDAGGYSVGFSNARPDSSNWGLRLHQYGGTITPKRTKYLAIPLEPLGREKKPRVYSHPLRFIFNRENKTPGYAGSLCWEDEAGKLHAAFVLRHETEVPALKERRGYEALPDDDTLATWAAEDFISKLNRL